MPCSSYINAAEWWVAHADTWSATDIPVAGYSERDQANTAALHAQEAAAAAAQSQARHSSASAAKLASLASEVKDLQGRLKASQAAAR